MRLVELLECPAHFAAVTHVELVDDPAHLAAGTLVDLADHEEVAGVDSLRPTFSLAILILMHQLLHQQLAQILLQSWALTILRLVFFSARLSLSSRGSRL